MSAWRPPDREDPLGCGVFALVYLVAAALAAGLIILARHGL